MDSIVATIFIIIILAVPIVATYGAYKLTRPETFWQKMAFICIAAVVDLAIFIAGVTYLSFEMTA